MSKIKDILKRKDVAIFLSVILVILFTLFTMKMFNSVGRNSVLISTSMGDITVELNSQAAPVTVKNFLSYVDSKFYNNLVFHRVISGFMIQGGGFDKYANQKKNNNPIELESDNGLKNEKYSIAMARTSAPNSATSQFFINTNNNRFLDYAINNPGYAVFGKVIKGQDVVDRIEKVKTGVRDGNENWPIDDVVIYSVRRI